MIEFSTLISVILIFQFIPFSNSFGLNLYDMNRPYYCSTCFSNTQDQNYHCCFYFFKCCAEARRGSRSTTPSPHYPGVPSQMTFIVQNRKSRPCGTIDCNDAKLATNLCCHMQNSQQKVKMQSPSSFESDSSIFKKAVNVQEMGLAGTDLADQNTSDESKAYETSSETSTENTSTSEGSEINDNPFNANHKNSNSGQKLFIPPSLAVDHVIEDSNQKGNSWMKQGWFTKEILNYPENQS